MVVRNRRPGGKFMTHYEPEVWEVVRKKGTMVTVQREGTQMTRNVSWFKKTEAPINPHSQREERFLRERDPEESSGNEDDELEYWPEVFEERLEDTAHTEEEGEDSPPPVPKPGNDRYRLRDNPHPSTRLRDFLC